MERWAGDPQYSHGYLIPLFSLYLIYRQRTLLRALPFAPSWWGILFLAIGVLLRTAEQRYFLNGFELLAIVPTLMGGILLLGGWKTLRTLLPACLFLALMVPLPFRIQTMLSGELQTIATKISTFLLVTFGAPAIAEGNVIVLESTRIGVIEACSGLGMIMTFVALSVGFLLLTRSPWWVNLVLILGTLPVALLSNVIRITSTALLYEANRDESARAVFHDLAGWLMIPLGCGLIYVELWIASRIIIKTCPDPEPLPLSEFRT
jgi:exosortase